MNKISLFIGLLLITLLGSCSKEGQSLVAELLEAVPAEAEAVAILHPEIAKQLDQADLKHLTDPDCGVDTTAMAVFSYKGYMFATGLLTDAGAFKKQMGKDFETLRSAEVSGRVMVADGRYWVALQRTPIDDIYASLSGLKPEHSMASTPFAEALQEEAPLTARLSSEMLFSHKSDPKLRMLMAMLFDDANSVIIKGRMANNTFLADGYIATSKGTRAKYLLPTAGINSNIVDALQGADAEEVVLIGAPNKMVRKLVALLAGADGGMLAGMGPGTLNLIEAINGTIAAAISHDDSMIIVQLNTDDQKIKTSAASLATALSVVYDTPVRAAMDGTVLALIAGEPQGKPALVDALPSLGNTSLAIAMRLPAQSDNSDRSTLALTAQFRHENSFSLIFDGKVNLNALCSNQ